MKYFLIAAAAAAGLYLLWIVLPAVICFFVIFSPKKREEFTAENLAGTCREPYAGRILAAQAAVRALPQQRVRVTAQDGTELRAGWFPNPDGIHGDTVILCVHGFRATALGNFAPQAEHFFRQGYSLLLIDQRAHNDSPGRFVTLGLLEREDLLRWIGWAAEQPGVRNLVLYGVSMGAATVAFASDRLDGAEGGGLVRALVADCGFDCPRDQMLRDCRKRRLPGAVLMPVMRLCGRIFWRADLYDSARESLSRTTVPAFFLHGTADGTVPLAVGRGNFDACASEKEWEAVAGAHHTLAYLAGGAATENKIDAFIEKYLR